jgi:hypothetical protein
MIDIDRIHTSFAVSLVGGQLSLDVQFIDGGGTVRNASISAFAIRDLASKLEDANEVLLDQLVNCDTPHRFSVTQGPERYEIYGVDGKS